MTISAIPEGYHSLTPYLFVHDAAAAIEFYKNVFGAEEVLTMPGPGNKIMHAEIKIGDSHLMLTDENPEWGVQGPQTLGGVSGSLMLYVEDVDAQWTRAIAAGAAEMRPVENQFWGDRMGTLIDPFGQQWSIATHIEDVSDEEMGRRMEAFAKEMGG